MNALDLSDKFGAFLPDTLAGIILFYSDSIKWSQSMKYLFQCMLMKIIFLPVAFPLEAIAKEERNPLDRQP